MALELIFKNPLLKIEHYQNDYYQKAYLKIVISPLYFQRILKNL